MNVLSTFPFQWGSAFLLRKFRIREQELNKVCDVMRRYTYNKNAAYYIENAHCSMLR